MPSGRLLLAIDGGQTATKALLAAPDGRVLGAGLGGPSDHFHADGGESRNREAIHGAILSALQAAGATTSDVAVIALGLTGAPTGGTQNPIVEKIVREIVCPDHMIVVADYVTNLAGASMGQPGVVVIAGGGAIAYGVTAGGQEAISGGFGYLLGDEGSAFDIGRRAITAAARAEDGRGPRTALSPAVRSALDLTAMRDVTRLVYRAGFRRDRISLLAPLVADAARTGDEVATSIMTAAGQELATAALAVVRTLYQPGKRVSVYLTGGVFEAGDVIRAPFVAALRDRWSEALAREPAFPPSVGGLILAARAANIDPDGAWLSALAGSLPR